MTWAEAAIRARPLSPRDQRWKLDALRAGWGSTEVARLGELIDAAPLPGFVADVGGRPVGLATYAPRGDEIEVVTIQALVEGRGVGTALLDELTGLARDLGARRLWLITTNDNRRAVAFYRARGMKLVRVVHDGVATSRQVKPAIPLVGDGGIRIRDELEFELRLGKNNAPT